MVSFVNDHQVEARRGIEVQQTSLPFLAARGTSRLGPSGATADPSFFPGA